jgi:hypothetical protein
MRQEGKLPLTVAQMAVRYFCVQTRTRTTICASLGLLVSACVNRAPEGLFGAAIAEVGVHDLLKVRLLRPLLYSAFTVFPSYRSLQISLLDTHGLLTMATPTIPTTLTSFIRSRRSTMCQPIKSFLRCYFLLPIVRDVST